MRYPNKYYENNMNIENFLDSNKMTARESYILGLLWGDGTKRKDSNNVSITSAVREGFDGGGICKVLKGHWLCYRGYAWVYSKK